MDRKYNPTVFEFSLQFVPICNGDGVELWVSPGVIVYVAVDTLPQLGEVDLSNPLHGFRSLQSAVPTFSGVGFPSASIGQNADSNLIID